MAKRVRNTYTKEKRTQILAAADKQGLTAKAVQKRFGVTPVTYYSWRKKAGAGARRRGTAAGHRTGSSDLGSQVRSEVQTRVRQVLAAVVRAEVISYLDSVFSSGRRRRVRV